MVMRVAYHLARRKLPEQSCKFSRHDFTLAQLFACLVVREFFDLSFRRTEALLADAPDWLADIGPAKAPDHNTLWRAFESLLATRRCNRMLDLLAELFAKAKLLTLYRKPLAIDNTCFEQRHRSGHYDRRCRRMALKPLDERVKRPGKWGETVNDARSQSLRRMPKLAIAVDSGCHLIISAKVRRREFWIGEVWRDGCNMFGVPLTSCAAPILPDVDHRGFHQRQQANCFWKAAWERPLSADLVQSVLRHLPGAHGCELACGVAIQ
jgi:hypothetical protein